VPFQYILANLLSEAEESVGVLFLDENGEAVEVSCSDLSPNEMKIVGAYLSIYLRQLERLFESASFGRTSLLHIESAGLHIYASPLPEGYFLVLVQRNPALVGKARRSLLRASDELARELFEMM
jgi:predicted regulator of Ras-like GTPase activity (Roadblock/LC7/MglB family)